MPSFKVLTVALRHIVISFLDQGCLHGRLAWTCGGALSWSRRVGNLCRLLFPITGVQLSFSSQMNLTHPSVHTQQLCMHWGPQLPLQTRHHSHCGQQAVGNTLRYYYHWSAGWSSTGEAKDKAGFWSAWGALIGLPVSHLAALPIGLAAAASLVRAVVPDFLLAIRITCCYIVLSDIQCIH